jgi:hypothetical protein
MNLLAYRPSHPSKNRIEPRADARTQSVGRASRKGRGDEEDSRHPGAGRWECLALAGGDRGIAGHRARSVSPRQQQQAVSSGSTAESWQGLRGARKEWWWEPGSLHPGIVVSESQPISKRHRCGQPERNGERAGRHAQAIRRSAREDGLESNRSVRWRRPHRVRYGDVADVETETRTGSVTEREQAPTGRHADRSVRFSSRSCERARYPVARRATVIGNRAVLKTAEPVMSRCGGSSPSPSASSANDASSVKALRCRRGRVPLSPLRTPASIRDCTSSIL